MLAKLKHLFGAANSVARARFYLRKSSKLGPATQVYGRVIVENAGTMVIGDRCRLRGSIVPLELVAMQGGELRIGDRTSINGGTSICAQKLVTIGSNCGIGSYTLIMDTDFHVAGDLVAAAEPSPIVIGDNVWLASRVIVLKGVTIGDGAVVSAGSVVATNVPPYTLVGGVPARIIRRLDPPAGRESAPPAAASVEIRQTETKPA
jgi:acetyltransferase-like isoleucine patch superfamily enzyme